MYEISIIVALVDILLILSFNNLSNRCGKRGIIGYIGNFNRAHLFFAPVFTAVLTTITITDSSTTPYLMIVSWMYDLFIIDNAYASWVDGTEHTKSLMNPLLLGLELLGTILAVTLCNIDSSYFIVYTIFTIPVVLVLYSTVTVVLKPTKSEVAALGTAVLTLVLNVIVYLYQSNKYVLLLYPTLFSVVQLVFPLITVYYIQSRTKSAIHHCTTVTTAITTEFKDWLKCHGAGGLTTLLDYIVYYKIEIAPARRAFAFNIYNMFIDDKSPINCHIDQNVINTIFSTLNKHLIPPVTLFDEVEVIVKWRLMTHWLPRYKYLNECNTL